MSTRSNIGLLHADRSVTAIYCHSDGYPSWNGKRLQDHWASAKKVNSLVQKGSMSMLGTVLGKKHDFDWTAEYREDPQYKDAAGKTDYDAQYAAQRADPRNQYCRFYKRDRGEADCNAVRMERWDEQYMEEFAYLWCETRNLWLIGAWSEDGNMVWMLLTDVLALDEPDADLLTCKPVELYPETEEDRRSSVNENARAAAMESLAAF